MAFSTQKDFMDVGFMNATLEAVCSNNETTKIKTYPSTTDTRAWSLNNKTQAKFFADIVACRTYIPDHETETNYIPERDKETNVDNIKDIKQLQDIINNLKKENAMLRTGSGNVGKGNKSTNTIPLVGNKSDMVPISDYNKIVEERNKLNDQLAKMVGLEDKIVKLKNRAMDADILEKELKSIPSNESSQKENNALKSQLDDLNCQCYENQHKIKDMQMQLRELNRLKLENNDLNNELRMLTRKVERMQCLEEKLCIAEHQICCNERIIQDYEYQFNQLMMVIEELEGKPCYCECECDTISTVIKDGHLKDLTLATKATIDQIKLEMCARGKLQEEIHTSKIELADFKYKAKMDIDQLQKDRDNILNETSDKCADILKQLEKCRQENKQLKKFVGEVKSGLIEELSPESRSEMGIDKDVDDKQRKDVKPTESEMEYMSEIQMSDVNEYHVEKTDEDKTSYYDKFASDDEFKSMSSYGDDSSDEFSQFENASIDEVRSKKPQVSESYEYNKKAPDRSYTDKAATDEPSDFSIVRKASIDEVKRKEPLPKFDEYRNPESAEYDKYAPDMSYKDRNAKHQGPESDEYDTYVPDRSYTDKATSDEASKSSLVRRASINEEERKKPLPKVYKDQAPESDEYHKYTPDMSYKIRNAQHQGPESNEYDTYVPDRSYTDKAATDEPSEFSVVRKASTDEVKRKEPLPKYVEYRAPESDEYDKYAPDMSYKDRNAKHQGPESVEYDTYVPDRSYTDKATSDEASKSSLVRIASVDEVERKKPLPKVYKDQAPESDEYDKYAPDMSYKDRNAKHQGPESDEYDTYIPDRGYTDKATTDEASKFSLVRIASVDEVERKKPLPKVYKDQAPESDEYDKYAPDISYKDSQAKEDRKPEKLSTELGSDSSYGGFVQESGPGSEAGAPHPRNKETPSKYDIKTDEAGLREKSKETPTKYEDITIPIHGSKTDVHKTVDRGTYEESRAKYDHEKADKKTTVGTETDETSETYPSRDFEKLPPELSSGKKEEPGSRSATKPNAETTEYGTQYDTKPKPKESYRSPESLFKYISDEKQGKQLVGGEKAELEKEDSEQKAQRKIDSRKAGSGETDIRKGGPIVAASSKASEPSGKSVPEKTENSKAADDPLKIGEGMASPSGVADFGKQMGLRDKSMPEKTETGKFGEPGDKYVPGETDREKVSHSVPIDKVGRELADERVRSDVVDGVKVGPEDSGKARLGETKARKGGPGAAASGKSGELGDKSILGNNHDGKGAHNGLKTGSGISDSAKPGSLLGTVSVLDISIPGKTDVGTRVAPSAKSVAGKIDDAEVLDSAAVAEVGPGFSEGRKGTPDVVSSGKAEPDVGKADIGKLYAGVTDSGKAEPEKIEAAKAGFGTAESGKVAAGEVASGAARRRKSEGGKAQPAVVENGKPGPGVLNSGKEFPRIVDGGKELPLIDDGGKADSGGVENGKPGPGVPNSGKEFPGIVDGGKEFPRSVDGGKADSGGVENGKPGPGGVPNSGKEFPRIVDDGRTVAENTDGLKAGAGSAESRTAEPLKSYAGKVGPGVEGAKAGDGVPDSRKAGPEKVDYAKTTPEKIDGGKIGPGVTEGVKVGVEVIDNVIARPIKIDAEKTVSEMAVSEKPVSRLSKVGKESPGVIDSKKSGAGKIDGGIVKLGKEGAAVVDSGTTGSPKIYGEKLGKIDVGKATTELESGNIEGRKPGSVLVGNGPTGPGKVEGEKVGAKIDKSGKVTDTVKAGPSNVEGGKVGSGKYEAGKVEPVETDAGKFALGVADGGKADPVKVDGGKTGPEVTDARVGPGKVNDEKAVNTGISDSGKVEPGKIESRIAGPEVTNGEKAGTSVSDSRKADPWKVDSVKTDPGVADSGNIRPGKVATEKAAEETDVGKARLGKVNHEKSGAGVPDGGKAVLGKIDSGKPEPGISNGKPDARKVDGAKAGTGVVEIGKSAAGVSDSATTGSGKVNGVKSTPGVANISKTGPQKIDGGKVVSGETDAGKADDEKPGAGLPDGGKAVVGKIGSGKSGPGVADGGKIGPGKVDLTQTGPGVAEVAKSGAEVSDSGKAGLGKLEGGKTATVASGGGKSGVEESANLKASSGKLDAGKVDPGVPDGGKKVDPSVSGTVTAPGSSPEKNLGRVSNDIDQCLKALEMLKKELRDAKENHELEKNALEKKIFENQKLREQLEEENEKYKFQRQKSKELDNEKADLEAKKGTLQNKLTESREALLKQKDLLGQQNELLATSKAELEKHRGELIKSKEQIASLEALNKLAQDTNKKLNDDIKAKQQEIAALNNKIKELQDKITKLEENLKTGDSGTKSTTDELANLKKTIANLNEQVANKEASIKDANNRIKTLNSEKESLNNEIKQNRKDLNDIQTLVGDIETQRGKNKDLEALVKNYENKLADIGTPITIADVNLQDAMNALKKQLQLAETKNNKLISELKESRGELEKLKIEAGKSGPVASDSASGAVVPTSPRKSASRSRPSPGMAPAAGDAKAPSYISPGLTPTSRSTVVGANNAVKQHVKSLEKRHSKSLLKLQNIYGDQMRDLVENHEREIQALKVGEIKLRGTLTKISGGESEDIKKLLYEIKSGMCTCKKSICEMTKLQRICQKIIDKGIEYLNVKELTHLHGEVYKAGLRLKPELLKHCDEKQRCCKCTDFSCCLPHLSKDMEKKLISRIIFLENEVDKANKILLHLKNNYSNNCAPNNYKFNDDLNDLLKTFCSDKMRCVSCANLNNQNRKCKSARLMPKQRREFDVPTRD